MRNKDKTPEPPQYILWCAFSDKLFDSFPITCTLNHDTYRDLKKKIRGMRRFDDSDPDTDDWVLWEPGRPRNIEETFIPEKCDEHLASRLTVQRSQSKDRLDVVVVVCDDDVPQRQNGKKDIRTVFGKTGLPYRPPASDVLLNSAGRDWDYQVSPELIDTLHWQISEQYQSYKNGFMDKLTIPLYLFLSGAGTGKSRNAAELHHTAYKCFNGTYLGMARNDELADRLKDSLVFHVGFEGGLGLRIDDVDPWEAIGNRMLLQLLPETDRKETTLYNIHDNWNAPTPDEVIDLLVTKDGSKLKEKTIFLVIDGLDQISHVFGEYKLSDMLIEMGGFAQEGFRIVCGTSSVTKPIKKATGCSSSRRTVLLPCTQLLPPTIEQKPIFNDKSILERALVEDCGGHGCALEVLAEFFPEITQHSDTELGQSAVKAYFRQLRLLCPTALSRPEDAIAVMKAAVTNRHLAWDQYVPGTQLTPDDICQHGLMRFYVKHLTCYIATGYFVMPYIWLLLHHDIYPGNEFFELQLLDYRDLRAKEDLTLQEGFSWSDFECLMIRIRKMKSYAFSDGQPISLGDLHRGAFMNAATEQIQFTNHHLSDEVSTRPFKTKTKILNKYYWGVDTMNSGRINMRKYSHIIRNGTGVPAGDAVLALDLKPTRNEVHQYKHVKTARFNFDLECEKAASAGDIIVMFCTSSIPSLKKDGRYYVPRNCILVAKENWDEYFGPYAARAGLFAELLRE